jgi:hypothetical protein
MDVFPPLRALPLNATTFVRMLFMNEFSLAGVPLHRTRTLSKLSIVLL